MGGKRRKSIMKKQTNTNNISATAVNKNPVLQPRQDSEEVVQQRDIKDEKDVGCKLKPSDWIQIIIAILTMVSVFFVWKTLIEMEKARDASYHPCIVMNPMEEKAEWDTNGDLLWLKEQTRPIEYSYEESDDGEIHGQMKVPIVIFKPSSLFKYSAVNIGVGTATEIHFEWNDENTKTYNDYLCSQGSKFKDFFTNGDKSDLFDCNNSLFMLDKIKKQSLMYMEPEARKTYDLYFPAQYSVLAGMIMKEYKRDKQDDEYLPVIFLNITFKDIQNKTFQELIAISLTIVEKNEQPDGSGSVTYQYSPQLIDIQEIK